MVRPTSMVIMGSAPGDGDLIGNVSASTPPADRVEVLRRTYNEECAVGFQRDRLLLSTVVAPLRCLGLTEWPPQARAGTMFHPHRRTCSRASTSMYKHALANRTLMSREPYSLVRFLNQSAPASWRFTRMPHPPCVLKRHPSVRAWRRRVSKHPPASSRTEVGSRPAQPARSPQEVNVLRSILKRTPAGWTSLNLAIILRHNHNQAPDAST